MLQFYFLKSNIFNREFVDTVIHYNFQGEKVVFFLSEKVKLGKADLFTTGAGNFRGMLLLMLLLLLLSHYSLEYMIGYSPQLTPIWGMEVMCLAQGHLSHFLLVLRIKATTLQYH